MECCFVKANAIKLERSSLGLLVTVQFLSTVKQDSVRVGWFLGNSS
ncbi:hypothetical protein AVDCRST_MAG94-6450 [uncultured Leptolyngbya sp.]|uniref:Uncharacterized protein n=1 Tax=uncultured Leptolyngbya sp. TaxID=332963 RepID=A0A6J4PBV1_9CYAN|nr:hypothetical protein AVDCRST_MAG94-6450 [uncultured Leptolyngbya sp.]